MSHYINIMCERDMYYMITCYSEKYLHYSLKKLSPFGYLIWRKTSFTWITISKHILYKRTENKKRNSLRRLLIPCMVSKIAVMNIESFLFKLVYTSSLFQAIQNILRYIELLTKSISFKIIKYGRNWIYIFPQNLSFYASLTVSQNTMVCNNVVEKRE